MFRAITVAVLILLAAVRVGLAQPPSEALLAKERALLAGTWQATSYVMDGVAALPKDLGGMQLVIDPQGRVAEFLNGRSVVSSAVAINPLARPYKAMDLLYTSGASKGNTALAIYSLRGDLLTLCIDTDTINRDRDKVRPGDFTCVPGSGRILAVYKRQQK